MKEFISHRFDTPLNIPEQKTKRFEICRSYAEPGTKMPAVSLRTSFFEGVAPIEVLFKDGRVIHSLRRRGKDGRTMMTDIPQEIYDHEKPISNAHGDVLVGGLGLGYYPSCIINKPEVRSVTVIEKEQEIIDMVKPYIDKRIVVKCADLFDYLKTGHAIFDYAYFDIWYQTGENAYISYVLPLRRLVWNRYGKKEVDYWKEKEMLGQFESGIAQAMLFGKFRDDFDDKKLLDHPCPIRRAIYRKAGYPFVKKEVDKQYRKFFKDIGSPQWEKAWGFGEKIDYHK